MCVRRDTGGDGNTGKGSGMSLRVKRIYEAPEADDGTRILVDRLWPRGLSKDKAHIDAWLKDLAPSDDLRRRFHARVDLWDEFCAAYSAELERDGARAAITLVRDHASRATVTLLYAAINTEHNNAVALKAWLERQEDGAS